MQPPSKKPRLSVSLPHQRADCPSYLFHHAVLNTSHTRNLHHCESCYCLVCDVPVSQCVAWNVHCMAFYTHPEWRVLRYMKSPVVPKSLVPPKIRNAALVGDMSRVVVDLDLVADDVSTGGGIKREEVVDASNGDIEVVITTPTQSTVSTHSKLPKPLQQSTNAEMTAPRQPKPLKESSSSPNSVQPQEQITSTVPTGGISATEIQPSVSPTPPPDTCEVRATAAPTQQRQPSRVCVIDNVITAQQPKHKSVNEPIATEPQLLQHVSSQQSRAQEKSQVLTQTQSLLQAVSQSQSEAQSQSGAPPQPLLQTQQQVLSPSPSQPKVSSLSQPQQRPIKNPPVQTDTITGGPELGVKDHGNTNCKQESPHVIVTSPPVSKAPQERNSTPTVPVTDAATSSSPREMRAAVQSHVGNARLSQGVTQEQQVHRTTEGTRKGRRFDIFNLRSNEPRTKQNAHNGESLLVSPVTPVAPARQKIVTPDLHNAAAVSGNPGSAVIDNRQDHAPAPQIQPREDPSVVMSEGRFIDPHKRNHETEDHSMSEEPSLSEEAPFFDYSSPESYESPGEGFLPTSGECSDDSDMNRSSRTCFHDSRRYRMFERHQHASTTSTEPGPPCVHVESARRNWNVDKLFPSPHITRRQNSTAPAITGKAFPQRVLIGCIDMWRPYCSHMSARNIELPVGRHAKDVASISSKTDVRVPGLKLFESEVIAREMGLDLNQPALYNDNWRDKGDEQGWPDMKNFVAKSSYANEDGTPMCNQIPEAMLICIHANLIEVRFELSHHTGAENVDKSFAMEHVTFSSLSRAVRRKLEREQCDWLTKCQQRLKNAKKLDTTNCCRLRARIYLTTHSFSSNMVSAANFSQVDSAHAHLSPLDGGNSLGHKLATSLNGYQWRTDKIGAPSMPMKTVLNLEKQWDNLELSTEDSYTRRNLAIVLSALRCHDQGYVAPIGKKDPAKMYRSVLAATTADGVSTWDSLCYSHGEKKDASLLCQEETLIEELRAISSEVEANTANKASIGAVLSSPKFTVSNGYHSTAEQPRSIKLSLRRYQRESLAWMLDQEKKRSISDPFWVMIRGTDKDNNSVDVFYCPMTGTMSRFAPPPVVGGVLAEEMGLGKTIIAVSLITSTLKEAQSIYSKPIECRRDLRPSHGTLIVCPVSLLKQWEKELRSKVSLPMKILCWYGSSRTYDPTVLASYDVVLTTYGIMSGGSYNALLNVHWFRVIIDESTYLKGGSASCGSALMNLISSRRWAVSGTPFGDSFMNKFMPTMRFIGVSPFAGRAHFQRLNDTFSTALGDPDLSKTLAVSHFAYVMKNIVMRHVKAQTLYGEPLVELPPASGRCVSIELDPNEKREYQKLENEVKLKAGRYLRSQRAFGSHFVQLAQMARPLRIMADGVDPEAQKPVSKKGPQNEKSEPALVVCKTSRPVGAKIKQLLRDLRAYCYSDSTSKFVVFTEFNSVKREIKRYLEGNGFGVMTLEGSMSATRRGRMIKQFTEDPDAVVLVLSMAAGACGLTLTMANVVVLFEVGLKMAMELQAVNRIHRIGQTRPVETLTYVAKGTIDERIVAVRKRRGQPGVVGEDPEGNGEELSTLEVYRSMFAYEG